MMLHEPVSPGQPAQSGGGGGGSEAQDRWRARFSKARQQSSRFFAGLLHRSDRRRERHDGDEDEDGEHSDDDEGQPRATFDPFHTQLRRRQRHASDSPSSRASFLSRLPPIETQLSALVAACARPSASTSSALLPPFFVLVDASGPRGRRLLRWLHAAADSASAASSSHFSGVLATTSSHDVQAAFNGLVALHKRHAAATSAPASHCLRVALAGPDSLLSHLLPAYISALTTSPSLPVRVYPIPLYPSGPPSAPSSSRVCAHLASLDNLYLSLFFSSAYQHAFDGASVEAEGATVLDAITRYVLDAAVTVKLPLGEVNIESAAATPHPQHSGGRDREKSERESLHLVPAQSIASSPAIERPHPAPVQVPPAADLLSAAPSLLSPYAQLHAISAPAHSSADTAAEAGDLDEQHSPSVTPPQRIAAPLATSFERKEERERTEAAYEPETRSAGRVTLPFVSDVAFLSLNFSRPRTTSDSELHRPPLHVQHSLAAVRTADEHHTLAAHQVEETPQPHHRTDSDSERKAGEHRKAGSVLSTFNKALQSITRTSSAADGSRHTKNSMSTVQLPPASALAGSKSDGSRVARLHKRRNSDSQTHYRGQSVSLPATHAATLSAQPANIPADLLHAPLLNRRISLSWFTSGKEKGRRGSADLSSGAGSGKMKKSSVKGTFERLLVQRIVDEGSELQHDKKEHKRSFMEQAMHSITHLPSAASLAAPSPAATTPSLSLPVHTSDHSPSAAFSAASASSSHSASVPRLSAGQLLLLARRRPPKESSLLHRLRDESSYSAKPATKVIVSAVEQSAAAGAAHSAHGSGGGELVDWGCLVDGVAVLGVSVVSVSAQVSGRVKGLAVQLFSAPAVAPS